MSVAGEIAASAQGELPETWRALEGASYYGDSFLERKVNAVMTQVFGRVLTENEQNGLDARVVEYAGKLVALKLITPGRDYWSKQATSISAGERENKTYAERSQALKELRVDLLTETREMFPEVSVNIPDVRIRRVSAPIAREPEGQHTPSPYDFEAPFAPPEDVIR